MDFGAEKKYPSDDKRVKMAFKQEVETFLVFHLISL
jgi:hypothetical protein